MIKGIICRAEKQDFSVVERFGLVYYFYDRLVKIVPKLDEFLELSFAYPLIVTSLLYVLFACIGR